MINHVLIYQKLNVQSFNTWYSTFSNCLFFTYVTILFGFIKNTTQNSLFLWVSRLTDVIDSSRKHKTPRSETQCNSVKHCYIPFQLWRYQNQKIKDHFHLCGVIITSETSTKNDWVLWFLNGNSVIQCLNKMNIIVIRFNNNSMKYFSKTIDMQCLRLFRGYSIAITCVWYKT